MSIITDAGFKEPYPELQNFGSASLFFDEIIAIEHVKLFEDFTCDEVEAFCRYMTCYAAPTGYRLLREGDEGDFLLLILTGKVEVLKQIGSEKSISLAIAEPGMSLGEMSLIDGSLRSANCDALVPTDFAVLSRASLNSILVQLPRLGNKLLLVLLQLMSKRLRDTSVQLSLSL